MKKARRWVNCHAQVTPRTASWMSDQRTTRAFVISDWSLNSASRSCNSRVSICDSMNCASFGPRQLEATANSKFGEKRTTYPLENLLPPNILQPGVQILDLLRDVVDLALVRALDLARLANDQIQRELDGAVDPAAGKPSAARGNVLRGDAEPVLTAVGGAEGKFSSVGAALCDDAVVVVEGFLDGYEDAGVRRRDEGFGRIVPYFCVVVACMSHIN